MCWPAFPITTEVSVSTAEPLARVLLSCEYAVKDFKVLGIEASPMSSSLSFSTEELYALDELGHRIVRYC